MAKTRDIVGWICRLVVAVILLQTLFFKFTGAPESIYIFEALGAEPWGRYGSGLLELLASVLILWSVTVPWGALLAAGLMAGAIGSHLTKLGIDVQGDGGLLFTLAITTFVCSLVVLYLERRRLPLTSRG